MKLIILGAPGSGKGTMATVLRDSYGITHISTGDIFRANIKENTPLGIEAKKYIDAGALVPDEVTISMVEDRLAQDDCKNGYLLDGFPRTIAQAEKLDEMLAKSGSKIDAVIKVDVPAEVIMARVVNRRVCTSCGESYNVVSRPTKVEGVCDVCGKEVIQRDDDKPETVKQRLVTYEENTKPLIDFYEEKGIVISADNSKDPKTAFEQASQALEKKGFRKVN
ncbi:MAG: adenylate kinase [Clostridiales bacterium]|nr:adenylate kinase [Clostridiales bacterium]